jgi:hypothetical protein
MKSTEIGSQFTVWLVAVDRLRAACQAAETGAAGTGGVVASRLHRPATNDHAFGVRKRAR